MQIDVVARGENPLSVTWLWRQYNQHRLVIPKLFLLADLRWFQAQQVSLLAMVFVIQFLHLLLLGWSMWVLGGWRGTLWRTGAGLAAFCLFCLSQWQNQSMGISGLCFDLPTLFASLSFVGLVLYWIRSGQPSNQRSCWKYLLLSITAAVGATLTLSNGNLLWPLLVAAALLLRLRLAAVLSLAIAGSVSVAVYLHNYARLPSALASLETPVACVKYVAVYFGSSWVRSNIRIAELMGVAGFAIFFFSLLQLPSYVRERRAFYVQLVLTLLFLLGTALITALGRLVFGIGQAFSSRYQAFSLLFWCCLALLLLGGLSLHKMRNATTLLWQIILLAIMLDTAHLARTPLVSARLQGFEINAAAVALATDVRDLEQLQWADSQPDYVRSLVPYLRKERLSFFAGTLPSLLGRPLDSTFKLTSPEKCAGELQSVTVVTSAQPRSVRITGWAWDYKRRQPPSAIVAASDNIITGLGVVGGWQSAVRQVHPEVTTNYSGFIGYVYDMGNDPGSAKIYAILEGSPESVCFFATAM
jgi:hypothetical protein